VVHIVFLFKDIRINILYIEDLLHLEKVVYTLGVELELELVPDLF
jgi:hypothetical protein